MHQFNVTLEVGDKNVGTVYLPSETATGCPVIVYSHGWNDSRKMPKLAHKLLHASGERNLAFVAFDFFGCGETGGDYDDMSYGRWTDNLRDMVAWVRQQPWADPARVGCLGISSGTTPALRLAQQENAPAFVISVATCLGLFIGMPNGPARVLFDHLESLNAGGRAPVFSNQFKLAFFDDFLAHQPVYGLKETKSPIYFLQGGSDNPWRRTDAWLGYLVLQGVGLPVKYDEIPEGGHGLGEEAVADYAAMKAVRWLESIGILPPQPKPT